MGWPDGNSARYPAGSARSDRATRPMLHGPSWQGLFGFGLAEFTG